MTCKRPYCISNITPGPDAGCNSSLLRHNASKHQNDDPAQQTCRRPRALVAFFAIVSSVLLLAFCSTLAHAQSSGEITGTVVDQSGAIIPKATVTLLDPSTGQTRTSPTNGSGLFDFSGLDIGTYNLTVSLDGFSTYKKDGIVLNVAQTLREDVSLKAGGQSQTVTVEANALQVQSETNEISSLITGAQMVQLATNGRNMTSLASLGTGVSGNLPAFNGVTAQNSDANLSFNGMRPDHNNWLIDGGEVYDRGSGGKLDVMPSPDVLAEFQVLSSNYPPDYGISSGGTVTMELKSGTKQFHGGLWEFNRNDDFDANNYFTKQAHQPSPELRLNIFGGDIGGPVWIPHLYNKDKTKTFFFWSEEWRKYISGAQPTAQNTVPLGDFPTAGSPLTYVPIGTEAAPIVPVTSDPAKLAIYTTDLLTPGQPFPNNTIPANLLDPNAVLFMGTGAIPKPNFGATQYLASPKQPTYVREDVVRIDQVFSSKYHLLGSWIHDAMTQTVIPTQWSGDSYSTVGDVFANPSWAAVIKLTQTLSPTLLNETALNVNGNTINVTPTGIYQQPSGWSATSFFAGNNLLNRLPQVAFGGGPLSTTYTVIYWPWHNSFLDYQFRDDLSKIWGKHSTKFGFSYMRADKNQQLQADTEGDYLFNGGANSFSGNSYVNFLLGFATTYQQLQTQRTGHYVNNTYSFYAQDDWHATERLTINLGLRYDALPHVFDKNNQLGNFNPASYTTANAQSPSIGDTLNPAGPGFRTVNGEAFYLNGIDIAGQNGVPPGLVKNDYQTIQPRLGFALDVFGTGRTVIRGGAGIFYERVQGNDTYNINTTPPFSYQPKATNVYFSNPNINNQTGTTALTPTAPAGLTNQNTHYPNPGTLQFSLGLQHELAPSLIASLGYVGTVGWDQDDLREINDLNPNSPILERQAVSGNAKVPCNATVPAADCVGGFVSTNTDLYRPYLGFSNIRQEENEMNFSYHSLQAALRMEQKHGLSLQVAYTWSHEIDISSTDLTTDDMAGSGGTLSNPYNANYDRGSGLFDRRNILNFNYIYILPFYLHSGNLLQREVLGGWQIAGVTVAESGTPVNVYYNGDDTLGFGGNTTNRPNLIGSVSYPKTQTAWFNHTAGANGAKGPFGIPVAPWAAGGTTGYGNAGKDTLVGPGLFNWNVSIYKTFPLTSNSSGPMFQLRAETFNTFNHTEFNGIDSGFTDANFGQVTSVYDPREFQFGAKFLF